jgi:hypothetical protein
MRHPVILVLSFGLGPALAAQMPPGWNLQAHLGAGQPEGGPWYGGGAWAADKHGPPATLVDGVGLGNALTGTGFHLEGGLRFSKWDFAAEVLGVRSPTGMAYMTLYRGHAVRRSQGDDGWLAGFEMEPLVWGYGLNGGYLLGDAGRPFPRARVASPMVDLHPFNVPLGTWGFQVFVGRLENHRELSASVQDPLEQEALIQDQGDPQAPLLNGYRVQAEFSDFMEFYANYIDLWGGTLNGVSMLKGYNAGDALTAMFGLKDSLAEGKVDLNGTRDFTGYKNKARSASNADVGFRIRSRPLERWLQADSVYGYVSRGSKSVWSTPGLFFGNPVRYMWRDLRTEFQRATQGRVNAIWNATARYTSPNLSNPNDAVGVLLAWPHFRLGLEYLDAVNTPTPANYVRPFQNSIYLTGFYYYGDPLGSAIGGEARITTVRVETDFSSRWSGTTIGHWGTSPFRDDPTLWQQANPGLVPAFDRFYGLQQTLAWRLRPGWTWSGGASWEHHGAVGYVPGASANGFQYFTDLTFRWPVPR